MTTWRWWSWLGDWSFLILCPKPTWLYISHRQIGGPLSDHTWSRIRRCRFYDRETLNLDTLIKYRIHSAEAYPRIDTSTWCLAHCMKTPRAKMRMRFSAFAREACEAQRRRISACYRRIGNRNMSYFDRSAGWMDIRPAQSSQIVAACANILVFCTWRTYDLRSFHFIPDERIWMHLRLDVISTRTYYKVLRGCILRLLNGNPPLLLFTGLVSALVSLSEKSRERSHITLASEKKYLTLFSSSTKRWNTYSGVFHVK